MANRLGIECPTFESLLEEKSKSNYDLFLEQQTAQVLLNCVINRIRTALALCHQQLKFKALYNEGEESFYSEVLDVLNDKGFQVKVYRRRLKKATSIRRWYWTIDLKPE